MARGLRGVAALGQRLVGREPDAHGQARAGAAPHRAERFAHVVQTPLRIAAPGVVAPVRALAQELRGQVAVRGAQLDAVEPGRARISRDELVMLDDLLDLVRAERARLDLETLARHRARARPRARAAASRSARARRGRAARRAARRRRGPRRRRAPAARRPAGRSPRSCGPSAGRSGARRWPRCRSGRPRRRRGPRGRRRSRPSAGRPRRASSGEPSRRCDCGSRPARSAAG